MQIPLPKHWWLAASAKIHSHNHVAIIILHVMIKHELRHNVQWIYLCINAGPITVCLVSATSVSVSPGLFLRCPGCLLVISKEIWCVAPYYGMNKWHCQRPGRSKPGADIMYLNVMKFCPLPKPTTALSEELLT